MCKTRPADHDASRPKWRIFTQKERNDCKEPAVKFTVQLNWDSSAGCGTDHRRCFTFFFFFMNQRVFVGFSWGWCHSLSPYHHHLKVHPQEPVYLVGDTFQVVHPLWNWNFFKCGTNVLLGSGLTRVDQGFPVLGWAAWFPALPSAGELDQVCSVSLKLKDNVSFCLSQLHPHLSRFPPAPERWNTPDPVNQQWVGQEQLQNQQDSGSERPGLGTPDQMLVVKGQMSLSKFSGYWFSGTNRANNSFLIKHCRICPVLLP